MAKTYYKYAKRETTPVDYAGAAKDLSEGLMATVTGLEKKADKAAGEVAAAKSKIEKEFAKEEDRKRKEDEAIQEQYGDKISKAVDLPLSYQEDYKTVQSVILDLSADAADLKANIKREYDAGNMTTKDYNRKVNNIRDQFKMMKQTAVTSLDMVTATNTSVEEGDALPAQHYLLTKMLKGRFDSANAEYSIDEDGNIFADITDPKTGKVEQMSVYDMNKLSMQRLKPFDIDGQAEGLVDAIGSQLEMARGSGETIEDLLEKAPIMKRGNEAVTPMDYIEKNINGYSPNQLSSILQMKMSGNYDISTDPNNFGNDNFIVYEVSELSGQYEAKLTENQKQDAKDFATEAILTQLNPLKKQTTKPSDEQKKRAGYVDKASKEIEVLAKLFEAKSPDDVNEVLTTYSEQIQELGGEDFQSARVVGDELVVEYLNPIVEEGEPKILEKRFKMPRDNFKDFVMTIGPAITGDDRLSGLYDEAVAGADIDVDELVGGSSSGEFKITSPMPEFSEREDVIMDQFDTLDSYRVPANRNENYISVADKYFEEFDIDGEASVSPKGVMTITSNGIIETVKLAEPIYKKDEDGQETSEIKGFKEFKSTRRTDLKNALKRIHNKLRKGASAAGGGGLMSGF